MFIWYADYVFVSYTACLADLLITSNKKVLYKLLESKNSFLEYQTEAF